MSRSTLAKIGLLLGSVAFCAAIAEAAARLVLPSQYHVWPPNTQRINETTEEYLHGVWGPSSFTVNAHGMRGDSYDRDYRYRVLAVGGSTTIGAVLDDDEVWPHAVQDLIDRALGDGTAFVGNVGRPGHTVAQHVLQIEKLLEQYDDLDAVMVLAGVNDLIIHLNILRGLIKINLKSKPDPQKQLRNAFSVVPASPDGPWYVGSGIASWLSTRRIDAPQADGPIVDAAGVMFLKQRQYRQETQNFLDELPDLEKTLAGYERKLNSIADLTRAKGVRLILLTQPSIWREDLPKEAVDRLWFGGPPLNQPQENGEYFTVRALGEGLDGFNQTMLSVCRARKKVECIDLASLLPKDPELFVDDVHYTERGSQRMAEIVGRHLLSTEPLSTLRQ